MKQAAELPVSTVRPESGETLAEAVYERLLDMIISGTLSRGTPVSAIQLSAQLSVSRTPIHEALRMLANDGFVEIQPGRRARVARFTRDDLWEIFEMRVLLEGRAAELAAGRMDERQLGPLRSFADELQRRDESDSWIRAWSDFDEEFHRVIAEESGNRRLRDDIARYRLLHRGFNRLTTEYEPLQRALSEHVEILDALAARDGKAARAAMENHIRRWQVYFAGRFGEHEATVSTR